jgi:hypothetical protein
LLASGHRVAAAIAFAAGLVSSLSCSFDPDFDAPYVGPPVAQGECGTTETLLPKLLAFVRAQKLVPLERVLETRLAPTPDNPHPDPSLRVLVGDLVRLVRGLGLDRTELVVEFVRKGDFESQVGPLVSTILKFMDGRLDHETHFEAGDATALFLRRCDPDHLLTAVEGMLRLKSPSHGNIPWLVALMQDAAPLISDPQLLPFLDTFQRESERGRPAILSLLVQILVQLGDESFSIDRIETLLESAIYPTRLGDELRPKIEPLVRLLDEATRPEAGVFEPLHQAVQCGLAHPPERDEVLGFLYDLVASEDVELVTVIDAVSSVLEPDLAEAELDLFADVVKVVRTDLTIRDDLRETVAILLSTPNTAESVPVFIDLIDEGVLSELFEALAKLLSGCGRA